MLLAGQDIGTLDQALQNGAVVLAPNFRSSDQLIDEICRFRLQQMGAVQTRPAISAIDPWLLSVWTSHALLQGDSQHATGILTSNQEKLLWRRIIRESKDTLLLLQEDSAADAMAMALQLLQQWRITMQDLRQSLSLSTNGQPEDDQQWAWHWLQSFTRICEHNAVRTFGATVEALITAINVGTFPESILPKRLVLSGFNEPPPLYTALFEALDKAGCIVTHFTPRPADPQLQVICHANIADECEAAACWAVAVMDADPSAQIGIICPDHAVLTAMLPRSMERQFAKRAHLVSSSAARPLLSHTWFAMAQELLTIAEQQLPALPLCNLLRSPWLEGADTERDSRAALERKIREKDELNIHNVELQRLASEDQKPWHCPVLHDLLGETRKRWQRQDRRQSWQHWVELVLAHWELWLPRHLLDSDNDRHIIRAADELGLQLQRLAGLMQPMTRQEALERIRDFMQGSNLQENRRQTPVILLNPIAAAGLHFTHLWCLGMNEGSFPSAVRLHPWLPAGLQKSRAMPGSDRNAAIESARMLISQWRNATRTQVVFSHAQGADDVPLRPSALLPHSSAGVLPAAATAGLPPRLLQLPPTSLERTDDSRLLPVEQITGASRLIEQQATCPFQAFAASRLHLKPLENPGFGLSPAALGTLIHEVLRHFWLQLEDTHTLAGLDGPQLQLHVDNAVAAGLDRLARRYPLTLTPGLRELEKDRLSALMHAWLEVERKRGMFRVLATETATHWQYRGLHLNLKLDRVDLQDGARVVIDYKTGSLPGNTWGKTSPRQFQLLLYLSALEQQSAGPQVRALLFAALHPAKMKYSGIAADDGMLAELDMHNGKLQVPETDWDALRERWQQELGSLALEILDGYAAVAPRQGDSCRYCDFGPLCRIDELRGLG